MSRRPTAPVPRRPGRTHEASQPTSRPTAQPQRKPVPRPQPKPPPKAQPTPEPTPRPAPTPKPTPKPRASSVVSTRSRAAFAARARARRWLSWRPVLLTAGALAVAGLAAWVVLASSLLAVREVTVVGAERLAPAVVQDSLGDVLGTPLARLDTAGLAGRVEQLPLVHDAEVVRAWPHTLEVRLVERVPIAAVPEPAGGVALVDDEGVVVAHEQQPPPDLPLVQVDVAKAGADALRAASAVVSALPAELRDQVQQVSATSPDDVRMTLRGGGEVVWGSAADSELKAEVLQALRSQPAEVYDVSSPMTPVTR